MTVYHGSYLSIEKPDVSFSRDNVDFGKGFYTTPIKEQAINWATRFKQKHGQGIISSYNFEESVLHNSGIPILAFDAYSEEWLNFIISCRHGTSPGEYALVIGGVANDKVFDTIQLYLDGLIDKSESLKRLRYEKPNIQYCFRSQSLIDNHLKFIASEVCT